MVVLFSLNEKDVVTWFWEQLRGPKRPSLNPVVVVGHQEPEEFHDENPAFLLWPQHQAYMNFGPHLLSNLLEILAKLEPIDEIRIARQIAASGERGRESRLLYRLHSWKSGDARLVADDLEMLERYFGEQHGYVGAKECAKARAALASKGWSPDVGVEFAARLSKLLRRPRPARRRK